MQRLSQETSWNTVRMNHIINGGFDFLRQKDDTFLKSSKITAVPFNTRTRQLLPRNNVNDISLLFFYVLLCEIFRSVEEFRLLYVGFTVNHIVICIQMQIQS